MKKTTNLCIVVLCFLMFLICSSVIGQDNLIGNELPLGNGQVSYVPQFVGDANLAQTGIVYGRPDNASSSNFPAGTDEGFLTTLKVNSGVLSQIYCENAVSNTCWTRKLRGANISDWTKMKEDNLGDHTATTHLEMSNKNINAVNHISTQGLTVGEASSSESIKIKTDAAAWNLVVSTGEDFIISDAINGNLNPLTIQDGTPSNTLYMSNNGKVGIGTNAPAQILHVVGNGYFTDQLGVGTASSTSYKVRFLTNSFRVDHSSDQGFFFNKIGGSAWNYIDFRKDGVRQGYFGFDSNNDMRVASNGTGQTEFINNTGTSMTITPSGEVGIGTTDPGQEWRLAVNGKIRAKEIKVETGWSDFVFEKDYDLPTLEEVEKHINDKGHLKDIPSAAEVAKNGILLGDMDSKLLQKIEELTLYQIEANKLIQALRKEVDGLKAEKINNK